MPRTDQLFVALFESQASLFKGLESVDPVPVGLGLLGFVRSQSSSLRKQLPSGAL